MSLQGGYGPIETAVRASVLIIAVLAIAAGWWQSSGQAGLGLGLRLLVPVFAILGGIIGLERLGLI